MPSIPVSPFTTSTDDGEKTDSHAVIDKGFHQLVCDACRQVQPQQHKCHQRRDQRIGAEHRRSKKQRLQDENRHDVQQIGCREHD
jgi:hypothetical protein